MSEQSTAHRVLVVSDDQDSGRFLGRLLEDAGLDVVTAPVDDVAIEMASAFPAFDAVLGDAVDALVVRRVRNLADPDRAATPVVILASYVATDDDERRALEAGASSVLGRPIVERDLVDAIVAVLPGDAGGSSSAAGDAAQTEGDGGETEPVETETEDEEEACSEDEADSEHDDGPEHDADPEHDDGPEHEADSENEAGPEHEADSENEVGPEHDADSVDEADSEREETDFEDEDDEATEAPERGEDAGDGSDPDEKEELASEVDG